METIVSAISRYVVSKNTDYVTSQHFTGSTITILANIYPMLDNIHIEQTQSNTRYYASMQSETIHKTTETNNETIAPRTSEADTTFELEPYTSTFEEYYPSNVNKILREQRTYKTRIDTIDTSQLSINRTTKSWQQCYYVDWLYHASFSPLWKSRIEMYEGTIDHKNHKVDFDDLETYKDDNTRFEEFYNHYNLEPDEQYSNTFIS